MAVGPDVFLAWHLGKRSILRPPLLQSVHAHIVCMIGSEHDRNRVGVVAVETVGFVACC